MTPPSIKKPPEFKCLSVLIPAYNEETFVEESVRRVLAVQLPNSLQMELIIVNDCSTDATPEILAKLVDEFPDKIRLFTQEENSGKGAAIRRAIDEATGDLAIFQDADLEYDPNEFLIMLGPILEGHADVVYGSRFAASPRRRILNYHHAIGNQMLTHLSNLLTGLNLSDMETCYKAFTMDLLKALKLTSNRFGIEPEVTAKVAKAQARVYEVPISYYGRTYGEGKKITWKDGVQAFFVILKHGIFR